MWKKALWASGLVAFLAAVGVFVYFYVRFSRLVDARLSGEVFENASLVFAAPVDVKVGQPGNPADFAARLRRALYAEGSGGSEVGTYRLLSDRLEIRPGPLSFFQGDQVREGPEIGRASCRERV